MTFMRVLNYSAQTYSALHKNSAHQFAAKRALRLYPAKAIYSFIPKNGCSTLRLSLALANGCIESINDFNWIHKNNGTFSADLDSLLTAKYTFTVLRCPYARLASAYLDKIAGQNLNPRQRANFIERKVDVDVLTFADFIHLLKQQSVRKSDIHWRPQVDFLVYKHYDDYFCLEQFPTAVATLKSKIGLSVVDARPLTKHGIDKLQLLQKGDFSNMPPSEILTMKSTGKCPAPKLLYTDELVKIVAKHYGVDIELYESIFGSQDLMFATP